MDDDVDGGIGDVEEEVRLDHLEPLVHHRRRVDRDLRSHLPARMGQRLGDRHARQRFEWTAQERTPRPGQNQTSDGTLLLAPQTLPDGAVLTIDGKDLRSMKSHPVTHELPRHDQDFLGCQGDVLAGVERRQGGRQRGGPGGGYHDHVDVRVAYRFLDGPRRAASVGPARIGQQGVGVRMAPGHRLERGGVGTGDHRVQREALGMSLDQVTNLAADGARRTEEGQAPERRTGGSHLFGLKRGGNVSHCARPLRRGAARSRNSTRPLPQAKANQSDRGCRRGRE